MLIAGRHKICGFFAAAFFSALCACVPLPEDYVSPEGQVSLNAPAAGLDFDSVSKETAHFIISAYSDIDSFADELESLYESIMKETGLYSFVPAEPYRITVYRDSAEYHAKTGLTGWSGGATYGNALLLYSGPAFVSSAAHEMSHLIFNEYMGLSKSVREYLWINEGLAVYMETKSSQVAEAAYYRRLENNIVNNPIPFSQMINLAPLNESGQTTDRWYAQAWSVVSFMLQKGGSFNFSVFLGRLKYGDSLDQALSYAYKDWQNLGKLEESWLLYINR